MVGKRQKLKFLIEYFQRTMPHPQSELQYESPFQLLVAVMLSAQCTDKRVNVVTPRLFNAFPTAECMAQATVEDVFELIKSVSYPNSKAAHLVETSKRLAADFQGEVPSTMEELTSLPGVGRKTANVVMAVLWKKPAFAVDTHIFRVAHRLGLADKKDTTPLTVETALTKLFPPELIPDAHHWLLLHGRYVCKSRTPLCDKCELKSICSFVK